MRLAAIALSVLVLVQSPQERPSFAGDWIAFSGEGDANAGLSVRAGGDGRMTITQDATTLMVAWVSFSRSHQPVQAAVNLDGSERRYVDRNSVEPQDRTTRARWQGTQLVITTRWAGWKGADHPVAEPVETDEILSLESSSTLKVSVTRRFRGQELKAWRAFRRQ